MSGRHAARRTALFLLYQWDVTGQPLASLYEGEIDPFARELADAVVGRAEELDQKISDASEGWPADRLGTLERNVLRIGVQELEEGDVPVEVAIDEAVSLAKRYASDEAGRLVNGILGRIARGEGGMSAAEESLKRAEELLERLEETRARLESTNDPDAAIDILGELADIAKAVEAELEQARREAGE